MNLEDKIFSTLFLIGGYLFFWVIIKLNKAIVKDALRHGNKKLAERRSTYLNKINLSLLKFVYPIIAIVLIVLIWNDVLIIPVSRAN